MHGKYAYIQLYIFVRLMFNLEQKLCSKEYRSISSRIYLHRVTTWLQKYVINFCVVMFLSMKPFIHKMPIFVLQVRLSPKE